jgi:hypothetical protein
MLSMFPAVLGIVSSRLQRLRYQAALGPVAMIIMVVNSGAGCICRVNKHKLSTLDSSHEQTLQVRTLNHVRVTATPSSRCIAHSPPR